MTIGERIKKMRTMHGWTLQELGDKVGVGRSTIRKWEEGQIKSLKAETIAKLSIALRCSPNYLIGTTDDPAMTFDVALTYDEKNILMEYRKTDDVTKTAIKRLLTYKEKMDE